MTTSTPKQSPFIVIITSLIISRALFFFINDPEGPNLLIVVVMAALLYYESSTISSFLIRNYKTFQQVKNIPKLALIIFIQLLTALMFFWFMK